MAGVAKVRSAHLFFVLSAVLAACGLYTPDKDPFSSDAPIAPNYIQTRQGNYEDGLVYHVVCEITQGLVAAQRLPRIPFFESGWGTTVTLSITVEDQTGLAPGVSLIKPLENVIFPFPTGGNLVSPQSFSLNIGGTASVNGLRTETIQFTVKNSDLINYPCDSKFSGVLIDGDLKIKEFIYDKAYVIAQRNGLWRGNYVPYNTWTEEITFVSSYGGTVTPTWHLARVSANTSSNLVTAQRTNTNDLIITLGPLDVCQQKPPLHAARLPPHNVISLSQLFSEVDQDRVHDVLIEGQELHGTFKDGRSFQTYAPSDISLVERLYDKGVSITARAAVPRSAAAQPGCPPGAKDLPLQLTAAAMNQHNARVQANAIAVSITGQTH